MCNNDSESIAEMINRIYLCDKSQLKDRIKKQYEIYLREFSIDLYNLRMENVLDREG